MARLTKKQQEEIKKQYDVETIWSYSRLSTYCEHDWEYYLKYIKKVPLNTENVYNYFGTICHDLIQDYIEGKHPQSKMYSMFNDKVEEWAITKMNDLPFPDKEGSTKIKDSYINNLFHYFKNTEYNLENNDFSIEKPVKVVYNDDKGNIVLVGYIDLLLKDGNKVYIVDFKTSSKSSFVGAKLNDSSKQLKLYATGIHQLYGIPYEDIVLRYDMQKYVNVSFLQKNGKWSKPSMQERSKWAQGVAKKIYKALEETGLDFLETEEYVNDNDVLSAQTLEDLPESIRDRFKIEQAFIDIQMTREDAKAIEEWCVTNIREAERRAKADDLEAEFPEPNLADGDSFYYNVLAKGTLKYHQGYQEEQALLKSLREESNNSNNDDEDDFLGLFGDDSTDNDDIYDLFK